MGPPPPIPSPFLRLYSIVAFSILAYLMQWALLRRRDHRQAMRWGMAAAFVWSGVDHFLSTEARYVPMLPPFLRPHGVGLVYFTGVTEILGAIGLVMPLGVYRRLGLPDLRKWAGIGIALMLACLMIANVNVAVEASAGEHFAYTVWLYYLRLLFQPVFMVWALYAAGVIRREDGDKI